MWSRSCSGGRIVQSGRAGKYFPGTPLPDRQRKKITQLAEALGWEEEKRVNGLAMKMFGVARVEWLDYQQCSKLIEALKAMIRRQEEKGKIILLTVCILLVLPALPIRAAEPMEEEAVAQLAEEVGDMYQICPELLQAIAWKESRYCPEVESKGCTGLMQVAGRWHQERMKELGADNLKDAHQNMLVAADYLQELVETYGDPVMVLMVYNGDSRAEDYWKGHCGPSDYAEEILELSAQLEVQHGK